MSVKVVNSGPGVIEVSVETTPAITVTSPDVSPVEVTAGLQGETGPQGATGPQGPAGADGADGADGAGVIVGGNENEFLQKNSATDYDLKWSAYTLPAADGTDRQVLMTDGAGTVSFAYPQTIAENVKNVSGGPLSKGTPVHVTGSVGNLAEVIAADAATNYPAHFVLDEDLADEGEGKGIALGFINNVDVPDASIYTEGQTVYLGASGGWTTTKPTGTNAIQNLGIIIKVNTSGNKISGIIMGAGRANDVPNIPQNQIWIGDASGVATPTAFGIDLDSTPQLGGDLDVNGNAIKGSTVSILGATGELMITATENGPVALRYDNNLKLSTKSDGVNITGELEADSLDIDGNADISGTLNTHTIPSGTGTIALTSDITGIDNVVDDTTPQLGGDLDVNGNKITSASNGDITIDPDGTGAIILKSDDIQFDGGGVFGGQIKLYESDIVGSNFIGLKAPLSVTSDTTFELPNGDGTSGQALTTNGAGALSWSDVIGSNSPTINGTLTIEEGVTPGRIALYDADGSNYTIISASPNVSSNTTFFLPTADGGANQVLKTNGSGQLSFVDQNTGTVDTSGTPVDNQIAVFSDSNTIEGSSGFVWNGATSELNVTGTRLIPATTGANQYYGDSVAFGNGPGGIDANIELGKLYYLGSSQRWEEADANAEATASGMLGMATADGTVNFLVKGFARHATWSGFSTGDVLYISSLSTGEITNVAPSGTGDIVRVIGYCTNGSAREIFFDPDKSFIEL